METYKEKFFNLLESNLGNVKPLLNERDSVLSGENDLTELVNNLTSNGFKINKVSGDVVGLPKSVTVWVTNTIEGVFYFFQFAPGGYFRRHNFVIQVKGTNKRNGTWTKDGVVYMKSFNTPNSEFWDDSNFNNKITFPKPIKTTDNKQKPVEKNSSDNNQKSNTSTKVNYKPYPTKPSDVELDKYLNL